MSCLLKNIPPDDYNLYGTGNRGLHFPLQSICGTVDQPYVVIEECYLALEEDGFTSLTLENTKEIFAPCV